jgi:hypothetical protein
LIASSLVEETKTEIERGDDLHKDKEVTVMSGVGVREVGVGIRHGHCRDRGRGLRKEMERDRGGEGLGVAVEEESTIGGEGMQGAWRLIFLANSILEERVMIIIIIMMMAKLGLITAIAGAVSLRVHHLSMMIHEGDSSD